MKHYISSIYSAFVIVLAAIAPLALASCDSDDSSEGGIDVGDITVSGIESSYTVTSFTGQHLTISPTVKTSFADDDMSYEWMAINDETGTVDENGDTIQPVIIGQEKDLDYAVELNPGTYQLRFIAKSLSTGIASYTAATLSVQTDFTQGFYILKENTEGKTDIDLYNPVNSTFGEDILNSKYGAALDGKPLGIYPDYNIYYVNPDNDNMEAMNGVTVITDNHDIHVYRSTDLEEAFSCSTLFYEEMDADEQPYAMFQTSMGYNVLFSSNGIYTTSCQSDYSSPTTGQFGFPSTEMSTSQYFFVDALNYGNGALWDASTHSLDAFNYNMDVSSLLYADLSGEELTQNLTGYECLHCGYNVVGGMSTGIFVLRDTSTGNRYLYQVGGDFTGVSLSKRSLLPASGHAAQATAYATNGISASYLYCLDGGKIYACVINSDELNEIEIQPEGISSDETICYIANQFWNSSFAEVDNFDYLIIGTQNGNTYKLYFYNNEAGVPTGEPLYTISGQGKVKAVRFLSPSYDTSNSLFGNYTYNINE